MSTMTRRVTTASLQKGDYVRTATGTSVYIEPFWYSYGILKGRTRGIYGNKHPSGEARLMATVPEGTMFIVTREES